MRFDELLAEYLEQASGDVVLAVAAEKFIARTQETEPEALDEWLHANARVFVTARMNDVWGRRRRAERAGAASSAFADAAHRFEAGDHEALGPFAQWFAVDDEDTRRQVAAMTGVDHKFVAAQYEFTGKTDLLWCAFHQAVAKKVGAKRTDQVLSVTQYVRLRDSILKRGQ